MESIGDRIEIIIKNERLKIYEFMDIIGVTRTTYYGWKKGEYEPNAEVLVRILNKFPKYNAEWLLLGKGEMKKVSSNSSMVAEANEVYGKQGLSKDDLKKLLRKIIDEIDNL